MGRALLLSVPLALLSALASAEGDPVIGRDLAVRWCASCHVVDGGQRIGDQAPPLRATTNDPAMTDDRLRGFLAKPHGGMPELTLSTAEIEHLIAYIRQLK
jgi:mono/diheme cytochrome c family protein